MRNAALKGAAALAAACLALAGCSSSGGSPAPRASDLNDGAHVGKLAGLGLTPAQPRPSFTLTDTTGKQFAFGATTRGHPTLLFFGYTHCPDVCPTTMADVAVALRKVPKSVARQTYVVFVTTDVKRDTGPVLAKWIGKFTDGTQQARYVGLTGTQAQVDAAQAAAHVTVAEDGGQTHSAELLLYGTDDYAHVAYANSTNEQQLIEHDLPLVASGRT